MEGACRKLNSGPASPSVCDRLSLGATVSSRFWPADEYEPGHDQPSYDKQYVRNWLESRDWDKTPPAPALPFEVVEGTRRRYLVAYQRLTGVTLKL